MTKSDNLHWQPAIAGLSLITALLAFSSCSCEESPRNRAQALARESLKIARLEQQAVACGLALESKARIADSLFMQMVRKIDQSQIREFVQTGGGQGREAVEAFLEACRPLDFPASGEDPAEAIISGLKEAPESKDLDWDLMQAYGAAFLLVLEGRRELVLRIEISSFLLGLGCPVTFADLGLSSKDSSRLQELAAQAAELTGMQPFGTEPFDFFITMQRLNDVASRFGRREDANSMAAGLLQNEEVKHLLPGLREMEPAYIGFLGDSQMDNRHWSSPAHYPNILAAVFEQVNPGVKIFNAGVGGDDSGEGLARIERDVISREPDICFVSFGGNDCAHWGRDHPTLSPEQFHENIKEIVRRLDEISCRVVLMTYPMIPEFGEPEDRVLAEMNEKLAQVRDVMHTGWLDPGGLIDSGNPRRLFAVDMIHFSPEGHLLIAAKILEYLSRNN